MPLGQVLDYISLYNIRLAIQLAGQASPLILTDLTSLSMPRTLEFAERKPGSSKVMVKVPKYHDLIMKAKGFNGDMLAYKDILPGSRLGALTIQTTEASPISIVQSDFFTLFPVSGFMIGDATTELGDDPSEWEFDIHTNVRGNL